MRIPKHGDYEYLLNPLDQFRTYDYIHIVAVCRAEDIQLMSKVMETHEIVKGLMQTPTAKTSDGLRESFSFSVDGNEDNSNPMQKYFILCNTAVDTDINVYSLSTETTVINSNVSTGSTALMGTVGQLQLYEPHGVNFLNMFRDMSDKLQCVSANMLLVVKTIFVGHTSGENSSIVTLTNVPPIYATVQGVKLDVTEAGSTYTLDIIFATGGLAYDPALTQSAAGINLTGSGTITDALKQIARAYTEDAENNMRRIEMSPETTKIPVQFIIEPHPSIADKLSQWTVNDGGNARNATADGSQPQTVPMAVAIEGAIKHVFDSSKAFLDNTALDDGFSYKIMSTMLIEQGRAVAKYVIEPVNLRKHKKINEKLQTVPDVVESILNGGEPIIIYDYIFTGKNTDIEKFDITIDEGFAFFQTVTSYSTVNDNAMKVESNNSGVVAGATSSSVAPIGKKNIVIGPGTPSNLSRSRNQPLTEAKIKHEVAVEKAWSVGAGKQVATLTLRGSPAWMALFATPPHEYDTTDREKYPKPISELIPFVYINIRTPTTWNGVGSAGASEPVTTSPFWYKGVWKVLSVKSTFMDGVFTNTLDMIAWPKGEIETVEKKETTTGAEATETTKTDAPAQQASGAAPVVTAAPAPATPAPPLKASNKRPLLATTTKGSYLGDTTFTLNNFVRTRHVAADVHGNMPQTQEILDNICRMAEILQYIQDNLKIKLNISSGYRSPGVNRAAGSTAAVSDHLSGSAVDITCVSPPLTPKQLMDGIIGLKFPFKQIIYEHPPGRGTWVHLAVSGNTRENINTKTEYDGHKYTTYKA